MKNKFVDFSNSEFVGQDYYDEVSTSDPYPYYNLQRIEKGESIGNFYMWRYAGHTEDGEWLVYDKSGDVIRASQATAADRVKVGNGMPKFTLSSSQNFRYRNSTSLCSSVVRSDMISLIFTISIMQIVIL